MVASKKLGRYAFDGIEFPVESCTIKGGLRDHVHEYPHADGGAPEKLGRRLYTFSIRAKFLDEAVGYSGLFPTGINTLRSKWEAGRTGELRIPSIGTILAYAVDWTETLDGKMLSGETAEVQFREDQEYLLTEIVDVTATSLAAASAQMILALDPYRQRGVGGLDLFDAIQNAVNLVTDVADQVELYGNQLEARILKVQSLCEQCDRAVKILSQPVNHRLLDALHSTWEAAVRLHRDVLRVSRPPLRYTTPALMSVSQIAQALYGDTSRAVQIMQMNPFEDPFRVPRGTAIVAPPLAA